MGEASAQKRLSLYGEGVQNLALSCVRALWKTPHGNIYHFFPNIFYKYVLKLSENLNIFWRFQRLLKGNKEKKSFKQ